MGWIGALRAYNRAVRYSERQALTRKRELEKQIKENQRQNLLMSAQIEVDFYHSRIEQLTTIHRDCGQFYDWKAIKNLPEPVTPNFSNQCEQEAIDRLEKYIPNFFDRIFGLSKKRKSLLLMDIDNAKKIDQNKYNNDVKNYEQELIEWRELQNISRSILQGDFLAYDAALREFKPFDEVNELGSKVFVYYKSKDAAEIDFHVNGIEVIPSESKSLLKNGMLSVKKISQSRYFELYQDYVASAVLRIAREIFAILPLEKVVVTALGDILNTSIGIHEIRPIISALIPRSTIKKLNFDSLDPSDAMRNFIHNAEFKRSKGFIGVQKLFIQPSSTVSMT